MSSTESEIINGYIWSQYDSFNNNTDIYIKTLNIDLTSIKIHANNLNENELIGNPISNNLNGWYNQPNYDDNTIYFYTTAIFPLQKNQNILFCSIEGNINIIELSHLVDFVTDISSDNFIIGNPDDLENIEVEPEPEPEQGIEHNLWNEIGHTINIGDQTNVLNIKDGSITITKLPTSKYHVINKEYLDNEIESLITRIEVLENLLNINN